MYDSTTNTTTSKTAVTYSTTTANIPLAANSAATSPPTVKGKITKNVSYSVVPDCLSKEKYRTNQTVQFPIRSLPRSQTIGIESLVQFIKRLDNNSGSNSGGNGPCESSSVPSFNYNDSKSGSDSRGRNSDRVVGAEGKRRNSFAAGSSGSSPVVNNILPFCRGLFSFSSGADSASGTTRQRRNTISDTTQTGFELPSSIDKIDEDIIIIPSNSPSSTCSNGEKKKNRTFRKKGLSIKRLFKSLWNRLKFNRKAENKLSDDDDNSTSTICTTSDPISPLSTSIQMSFPSLADSAYTSCTSSTSIFNMFPPVNCAIEEEPVNVFTSSSNVDCKCQDNDEEVTATPKSWTVIQRTF